MIRATTAAAAGRRTMLAALLCACVPEGPPTSTEAPPKAKSPASASASARPHSADPPLAAPFRDDFERQELGEGWLALSPGWHLADGQLCVEKAQNRGIWLRRRLPPNARIEFDARSASADGDIKAEAWGDGRSGAVGASYDEASSYVLIFGGWKNEKHVLARLDEHGEDRRILEVDPASDDPRQRPVEAGQVYRFAIERRDGKTVSWWVDDMLLHELTDPEPLAGPGHDHFGFNDWMTPVCFDNLVITPFGP